MPPIKAKPMHIEVTTHIDLMIERDSGNPILILMGRDDHALVSWKKLRGLCDEAIDLLEERIRIAKMQKRMR